MLDYQGSFTGGEINPALYGRTDMTRYQLSLRTCRNFIVQPQGGLKNRPGTKYIAATKSVGMYAKSRLFPFTYSVYDTYVLEVGSAEINALLPGYIRLVRNGAQLVYPTGYFTAGDPVEVRTQMDLAPDIDSFGYTGYEEPWKKGDVVSKAGVNYTFAGTASKSTPWATLVSGGTVHASPAGPVLVRGVPFTADMIDGLQTAQMADVLFIVHPKMQPKRLERRDLYTWVLIDAPFKLGPWQDMNTDKTNVLSVEGSRTVGSVVTVHLTNAIANAFSADNIGQLLYVESQDFGQPWEVAKTVANGDERRSDGK